MNNTTKTHPPPGASCSVSLTCSQISYTPPPTVPPPNIPTLSGPPMGDGPVVVGAASVSAATMRRAARIRLFCGTRGVKRQVDRQTEKDRGR